MKPSAADKLRYAQSPNAKAGLPPTPDTPLDDGSTLKPAIPIVDPVQGAKQITRDELPKDEVQDKGKP